MNDQSGRRDPVHFDELARIKGIKDARQQLLRDKLGIRTFRDLASASAEVLLSLFRAENHPVSRSAVEVWIREAARLASEPTQPTGDPPMTTTHGEDWHAFALFVVEFQERTSGDGVVEQRTKVHHMETDHDSVWEGTTCQPVCEWVAGELRDHNTVTDIVSEKSQPKPVATVLPTPIQMGAQTFNERLEQILATVQRLSPPEIPIASPMPIILKEAQPAPPPPAPTPQSSRGFSSQLTNLILRVETNNERAILPTPAPRLITPLPPPETAFSPTLQRLLERYRQT